MQAVLKENTYSKIVITSCYIYVCLRLMADLYHKSRSLHPLKTGRGLCLRGLTVFYN